jgi:hypothetical protein
VSVAEVWLKGAILGRIAAPLLSWQIRRVATRTLAASSTSSNTASLRQSSTRVCRCLPRRCAQDASLAVRMKTISTDPAAGAGRQIERIPRRPDAFMLPRPLPDDPGRLVVDATWGTITPINIAPGVRTVGELEVIAHIRAGLPLIDCRLDRHVAAGTLPAARSLPHADLPARAEEVDRAVETVLFCNGPSAPPPRTPSARSWTGATRPSVCSTAAAASTTGSRSRCRWSRPAQHPATARPSTRLSSGIRSSLSVSPEIYGATGESRSAPTDRGGEWIRGSAPNRRLGCSSRPRGGRPSSRSGPRTAADRGHRRWLNALAAS